jgi:hypothetical protein
MDILVGSLNAMDTRAGSSAAANIPRREYRRGEYGERGGYGKYRAQYPTLASHPFAHL